HSAAAPGPHNCRGRRSDRSHRCQGAGSQKTAVTLLPEPAKPHVAWAIPDGTRANRAGNPITRCGAARRWWFSTNGKGLRAATAEEPAQALRQQGVNLPDDCFPMVPRSELEKRFS